VIQIFVVVFDTSFKKYIALGGVFVICDLTGSLQARAIGGALSSMI